MDKKSHGSSVKLFYLLCLSLLTGNLLAQPKYFKEAFDKNAGWQLSAATAPDSARFEIKDGSLILYNNQRSPGMVELKMPFNGDLAHDADWEFRLKVRHISGSKSFNYGICQGGAPGTYFTDGLCFGLAASGYFRIDSYFGKTKREQQAWKKYNPIDTTEGGVNDIRIIYRAPWGFYVLINDHWAYTGRGNGKEGNALSLFAEGHQTIAFDDIQLVSYRGQFTKLADIRAMELKEICAFAVDSFSKARDFPEGDQYKTWLPEIFICNKDYKIFRKTEGVFPKKIGRERPFYVYSISTDYLTIADRDAKRDDLASLIKNVFVSSKQSTATIGDKKLTYFFAQNPDLPKGTIAILQEYTFRRNYEKEDHYYIDLMVLNAPDVSVFK